MAKRKSKPLVSVVIPVFNGSSFVEEAVRSVFKSSFGSFEVLLIDDGSTDKSKQLCRALAKKYKRVFFHSFEKNRGLGRVLNFALKKARGEYICRLNQDDLMLPQRMKTQVLFLEKRPEVVAAGSHIKLFYDDGSRSEVVKFLPTDEEIKRVWFMVSPFADPSVMYRREPALKAGGYRQEMWPADDTDLWYRLGKLGKLANIQKPLVEVRWHKKAGSVKYWKKMVWSTYKMHRWAHSNVGPAPLSFQIFWLVQVVSGTLLSAEFNWKAYRLLKRVIYRLRVFNLILRKRIKMVVKVVSQPKRWSLSGQ